MDTKNSRQDRLPRARTAWIIAAAALAACLAAASMAATARPEPVALLDCKRAPDYAFLDWAKAFAVEAGGLRLRAPRSAGGAGFNIQVNVAGHRDWTPAIRLTAAEGHGAARLRLILGDADGTTHEYAFDLAALKRGEPQTVTAENGASLAEPGQLKAPGKTEGFDAARLTMIQVQGDWSDKPVDLLLAGIVLVEPNEAILAERAKLREKRAREAERARREAEAREKLKRELLANPVHPADGPAIVHVGAVAPDVIALVLQEKTLQRVGQQPYEKQPGDEWKRSGDKVIAWEGDTVVETPIHIEVERQEGGRKRKLGALAIGTNRLHPEEPVLGAALTVVTVDEPAAYRIQAEGATDAQRPARVWWKRKPNQIDARGSEVTVFLKLAAPMAEGTRCRVRFAGVNASVEHTDFVYAPRTTRSIAVHASQVGYRPDDPFKRALLSVWLGTGGAMSYADGTPFHLLDEATGAVVFSGTSRRLKAAADKESFKAGRNYGKTDVHALDFGPFSKPGRYRVCVEGVGCSYPFEIARDAWERAFRTSMMGLLHHRSGIELGPPFTDYRRPRNMHPADGFRVVPMDRTMLDGEIKAVLDSVRGLVGKRAADCTFVPEAWGGYMDAGDWDRRSLHLSVTYLLLELYELFPDYFATVRLSLPPDERANALPDILDEALWDLSFYRRLQLPDGGVRGGIESTAHPRPGECSWQETLVAGVFAPDHVSSWTFAASAAKFARVAERVAPKLAAEYREAAVLAWKWAEANAQRVEAAVAARGGKVGDADRGRNLAAVELFALTRDAAYHDAFLATTVLKDANPELLRQQEAAFAYTRLPEGVGDAALKRKARDLTVKFADAGIRFAEGNAWGLTTDVSQLPPMGFVGYFTAPGMISRTAPRAWALTGDERFLASALRACQFAIGVNPDNLVYTTGLGHKPVRNPLHIDSRMTGQPAPAGITVYGISDPAERYGFDNWAYIWYLGRTMVPDARTWPAAESHWDIYLVPSSNEYTVHQTIAPTAYTWGFLAARADLLAGSR
ncbi:MAG TPA: glycoside hydrolase family 9 protein [Planctomycetota bacterium]|nr:glycoside hydrolase family 9 protein [Planctomycetota bacterium]